MHEYEIRILKPDHRSSLVIEAMHLHDSAAVRAARKLAEGREFEVWRGLDCVYGTHTEVRAPWENRHPISQPPRRRTGMGLVAGVDIPEHHAHHRRQCDADAQDIAHDAQLPAARGISGRNLHRLVGCSWQRTLRLQGWVLRDRAGVSFLTGELWAVGPWVPPGLPPFPLSAADAHAWTVSHPCLLLPRPALTTFLWLFGFLLLHNPQLGAGGHCTATEGGLRSRYAENPRRQFRRRRQKTGGTDSSKQGAGCRQACRTCTRHQAAYRQKAIGSV